MNRAVKGRAIPRTPRDIAGNEAESEAVEASGEEALSTFTNPDTSVESASEDVGHPP